MIVQIEIKRSQQNPAGEHRGTGGHEGHEGKEKAFSHSSYISQK
jgi:hypothetical protein